MSKARKAIVVSKETREFERIRAIEDALHERAAEILQYSMMAPDLSEEDRAQTRAPGEWRAKFTKSEEAERAFRVAKAAWESQKEAPVFLKIAPAFLAGSMKARSNENAAPKTINATVIATTAPLPVFPERVVKSDNDD